MSISAIQGLLSYMTFIADMEVSLGKTTLLPLAVINPWIFETGFIFNSSTGSLTGSFLSEISEKGYDLINVSTDPHSKISTAICSDKNKYMLERVLRASFCKKVTVKGLTAYDIRDRLIMPPLTMLDSLQDKRLLDRFQWMEYFIDFTKDTQKYLDFSNNKWYSFQLSSNVKISWNNLLEKTGHMWEEAPEEYEIKWREALNDTSHDNQPKSISPLEILTGMMKHPKNDKQIRLTDNQSKSIFLRSLW